MARPCANVTVELWVISKGREDALHVARPVSEEGALGFGLVRPASLKLQGKHTVSNRLKIQLPAYRKSNSSHITHSKVHTATLTVEIVGKKKVNEAISFRALSRTREEQEIHVFLDI